MEPADDANLDPRQAAGQAEQQGQLADAVMALPEDLRQVVLLHYAEGMTPSDIARLNGEAPSTVTRRLEKARVQLREHLEGGLAVSLAMLKPRQQQFEKLLVSLAAAAALPAASRAPLEPLRRTVKIVILAHPGSAGVPPAKARAYQHPSNSRNIT